MELNLRILKEKAKLKSRSQNQIKNKRLKNRKYWKVYNY